MMLRIWRAYRVEIARALRSWGTYGGPAVLIIAILVAAAMRISEGGDLGYSFIAYATGISYGFTGLFFILGYASISLASDVQSGAARLILTRSIRRHEYILAKAMCAMSYGVVLLIVSAAAAWGCTWARGEMGGVMFGGEVIYTARQMQWAYAAGMALCLIPMAAAVAFGMACAVFLRSPAAALCVSVGSWLILDAVKYPLGLDRILFWSYWTMPWAPFRNHCDVLPFDGSDGAVLCVVVSAVWISGCLTGCIASFRSRDL